MIIDNVGIEKWSAEFNALVGYHPNHIGIYGENHANIVLKKFGVTAGSFDSKLLQFASIMKDPVKNKEIMLYISESADKEKQRKERVHVLEREQKRIDYERKIFAAKQLAARARFQAHLVAERKAKEAKMEIARQKAEAKRLRIKAEKEFTHRWINERMINAAVGKLFADIVVVQEWALRMPMPYGALRALR